MQSSDSFINIASFLVIYKKHITPDIDIKPIFAKE